MKTNELINIKSISALFFITLLMAVFIFQQHNNISLSPYVGNPIHAGTGNKYQVVNDYSSSTGGTSFSRYYNSLDKKDINIGTGWRYTYSRSLDVSSSITIRAKRDEGKTYTFTNDGTGNWSTDPDVPVTLSPTATGWLYSKGNNSEAYDTQGKLVSISDKIGIKNTLTYDTNNKLNKAIDRYSRETVFSYDAAGKLSVVSFPTGVSVTYTYDVNNNLVKAQYADTTSRQYLYEDTRFPNALTGRIDENNNQISNYEYDSSGRANLTEKTGGINKYTLVYNADDTTTVTDPSGKVRIYHFETQFDVTKVIKIEGGSCSSCSSDATAATYDANGYLASKTDFNGNVTTYVNNAQGLQTSRTEAVGTDEERTITTIWNIAARTPQKITEPGKTTDYYYDSNGNLTRRTQTDTVTNKARTVSYTYNSFGQVLTVNGARTDVNDVTIYTYDTQGNRTQVENTLGHKSKITSYDAAGRPLTLVDANGLTTTLTYDGRGRLKSRNRNDEVTAFDYDNVGNLNVITKADGSTLTYGYDLAQRLTSIEDQLGNTKTYTLDAAGNRIKEDTADAEGDLRRTRQQTYNHLNQLVNMIGAQGQTTSFAYDGNGNRLTVTDPVNKTTTSAFDALNRLTNVTDPLNGVTRYGYDNQNNLVSVTDANGNITTYRYDGFGDRIQQTSPDTGITKYEYDEAGNMLSQLDAKGQLTHYQYDVLNRLLNITYHDATTVSYIYDLGTNGIGRLTTQSNNNSQLEYTYDVNGRIKSKTQTTMGLSLTTHFNYDNTGRLLSKTLPSGLIVGYLYTDGKLSGITLNGQPLINQINTDPFGPVISWTWANGAHHSRGYNLDGQLIDYSLANLSRSLVYDPRGNLINQNDITKEYTFSYDALNRIVSAKDDLDSTYQQAFDYDANGNRLSFTDNESSQSYYYISGTNRLSSINGTTLRNYAYDENGNILSDGKYHYGYDIRNRMVSVDTDSVFYNHNPLGQRIYKYVRHPFDLYKDDVFTKEDIKLYRQAVKKGEIKQLNDCDGNDIINKDDVKCLTMLNTALKKKHTPKHNNTPHTKGKQDHNTAHKVGADDETHGYHYGIGRNDTFDPALLHYQPETFFNYSEQGQLIGEYNTDSTPRQEVIYLGQTPLAVVKNGNVYYIHTDHLGTPRTITDSTSNTTIWSWFSDPFGQTATNNDPDNDGYNFTFNLRFPGQYYDSETGLHYNYFRDYDPSTGRYVQSDPIGLVGGLNTYGYVNQNPLSWLDILGLSPGDFFETVIDAVLDAGIYARSFKDQSIEYGGWVYPLEECEGTGFTYNFIEGDETSVPNIYSIEPEEPVAGWHTHPITGIMIYDALNERFSGEDGDKGFAKDNKIPIYLITPSNHIKRWPK